MNLFRLDGRVALVTGASSGIGRSLASALAGAGAAVVLTARRADQLEMAASEIRDCGGEAVVLPGDLDRTGELPVLARRAQAAFGRIDVLVNAAGINLREPLDHVTLASWYRTLDIHLTAPFLISRALATGMRQRRWGRIINLGSLQSTRAFADSLPYGAAKAGVLQMTRAMAQEWSPHGINCNAIVPGFFPTQLTAPVFGDPARAAANAERTMIGRNGELEELHGAAIFLASDASAYITGQVLYVDGGFSAK